MIITVPPPPFSPWLRLAHRASWLRGPSTGRGNRRQLRDWKFLLQLSGESWLWYERSGGRWPLHPGDLALVPPGQPYAWGVPAGSHVAIHFDLHAKPDLMPMHMVEITGGMVDAPPLATCPILIIRLGGEEHRCRAVVRPPAPRRWQERFAPLIRQYGRGDHHRPEMRLAAGGILAEAVTTWLELARQAPARAATVQRSVGSVVDELLRTVPSRDLDVPTLARRAGVSSSAFRAAFHQLAGLPPRAWMERRRIEHAGGLLRDAGLGVAEAAAAVGYADPFHFARVFRRVQGCSPRSWRSHGS